MTQGSSRIATGYVFPEDRPSFVCTCHSLEEGSNSMVRVCVDDPILDANGEFTGFYRAAGPFCPEVSVRTLCYLNLERESVGGAVAGRTAAPSTPPIWRRQEGRAAPCTAMSPVRRSQWGSPAGPGDRRSPAA